MVSVRQDGWAQRGGIDRVLTLRSGKTISVDEKVRYRDYADVLLEVWSVWVDGKGKDPGWIAKDLACDYIAYAWVPTERCLLLPFQELRRVWRKHHSEWMRLAINGSGGFCRIFADNGRYQTMSICVPESVLRDAIRESMLVSWTAAEAA